MRTRSAPNSRVAEPRRPSGRTGLTLVEVVFASGILSIFLLGVFSAMAHSMRMETLTREREAATRTALRALDDRVMAIATEEEFEDLPGLTESFDVYLDETAATPQLLRPAATSPNPNARTGLLTVTIEPSGTYAGEEHLLRAEAKVRWRGVDGRDQEVIITSLKVRPIS